MGAKHDPPPLPPDVTYTSCYCEENAYLLCATFSQNADVAASWDVSVAFVSNARQTVALWSQKASRDLDGLVVWDYHVVLCLRSRARPVSPPSDSEARAFGKTTDSDSPARTWIYDFDTRLGLPCDATGACLRVSSYICYRLLWTCTTDMKV
ncbi:hypothetical protein PUNSTDRAFT_69424 [Punctularia strigosozonata HHB-11173 SS5]|uniref:uncharacterized protein n=1 Tax=Punctularia strigosozonata (strain HHB-11173) TaxID=741275 RepID=UPI0004416411|nr:uncharacterized protein PUNSTDRAFT_69424 [Punctularia strigosozonata HHB-11173 SS5]EIN07838.1 hypothetical protein PUNSTDRAFT_69424 [Punctularia strigosozonata HHB-11173 SS5]